MSADSSFAQVFYLEETTWGTTPASALKELRVTGESLNAQKQTVTSQELRSDRQVPDIVQVGENCGGDVSFELSYAAFDDILEGAFMSDWSANVGLSETDISAVNSDNSYNSVGVDFSLTTLAVGQWIKVSGFTDAANNGLRRVQTIAGGKITVSGGTLADEAAGDTVTISSSYVKNGVTKKSYTVEKSFTDVTEFVSYTGMRVGSMTLNAAVGQLLGGSFSFQGKKAISAGATVGTGSAVAAPTNDVLNAVSNISATTILEGGAALTFDITNLSITMNNSLRPQQAIGSLANVGIGIGRMELTGSLSAYFEDNVLYEKFLNFTETSLSIPITDGAGNVYVLDFPAIKFTSADVNASSIDQDVLVNMNFTAKMDASELFTISLSKIDA